MPSLLTTRLGAQERIVWARLRHSAFRGRLDRLEGLPHQFQPNPVLASARVISSGSLGLRARTLAWVKRTVSAIPWLDRIARRVWARLRYRVSERGVDNLSQRLNETESQLRRLNRESAELRHMLSQWKSLITSLKQRLDSGDLTRPRENQSPSDLFDSSLFRDWYNALENAARGSEQQIQEKQSIYLDEVRRVLPELGNQKVLDLGCGRAEWLGLLAYEGFDCFGVEVNQELVSVARDKGLRVTCSSLEKFLSDSQDCSFACVTAFQVVEHLDLASFLGLFKESYRVLVPGGVLILETPNPENLQVGAFSFWGDPTHQKPIPPALATLTAQHFGFRDLQIKRSSPWSESLRFGDASDASRYLEKLLFTAGQDYALIARKPKHHE